MMKKVLYVIALLLFVLYNGALLFDHTVFGYSANEELSMFQVLVGAISMYFSIFIGVLLLFYDLYQRNRIPAKGIIVLLGVPLLYAILSLLYLNPKIDNIIFLLSTIVGVYAIIEEIKLS